MNEAAARLSATMMINCPKCKEEFDLLSEDDGMYTTPVFNNNWDALKGEEVICTMCEHEFKISEVVWY